MIGGQAAREQERRARVKDREEAAKNIEAPRYDHTRDPHLRLEVLRLAQEAPTGATVSADDVVQRATTYIAFIKGESSV